MIVAFLGPSLPAAEAKGFRVLPPARQGDVWRAIELRPRAIALVDGVFESQPSVWHQEILDAPDAGIPVIGGASMGALRAAELHTMGMRGVGRIFRWYRDGEVLGDSGRRPPRRASLDSADGAAGGVRGPQRSSGRHRSKRRSPHRERTLPQCWISAPRGRPLPAIDLRRRTGSGSWGRTHGTVAAGAPAFAVLARAAVGLLATLGWLPDKRGRGGAAEGSSRGVGAGAGLAGFIAQIAFAPTQRHRARG